MHSLKHNKFYCTTKRVQVQFFGSRCISVGLNFSPARGTVIVCPVSIFLRDGTTANRPTDGVGKEGTAIRSDRLSVRSCCSTLCLKTPPIFTFSITSSNVGRFSYFFHWLTRQEICNKVCIKFHHTLVTNVATLPCETLMLQAKWFDCFTWYILVL